MGKTKWFGKGGFFDKLWVDGRDAVRSTAELTAKTSLLGGLKDSVKKLSTNLSGMGDLNSSSYDLYKDEAELAAFESVHNSTKGTRRAFTWSYTSNPKQIKKVFQDYIANEHGHNPGLMAGNKFNVVYNEGKYYEGDKEVDALRSKMFIPDYGYDILLNERTMFQKGLHNFFGAPTYFYFKIFFKFDTQYGLFGGLFDNPEGIVSTNSASGYLTSLSASKIQANRFVTKERQIALKKFANTLSYINCNAPWFFTGVRGLDKANTPVLTDFVKDQFITIMCNTEAIDMRLNTLMDLYKFVVYDDVHNVEVLPDNCRKFDMCVMIFQSPIKKLHTPIANKESNNIEAFMPNTDYSRNNFMGFKLFNFIGCEIDLSTSGSMVPGDVSNETPFQMGKGQINIKYNKCIRLNSNEFEGLLFGDYGLFYDFDTATKDGGNKGASLYGNIKGKDGSINRLDAFKHEGNPIIDYNEQFVNNNLMSLSRYTLGNIYGEKKAYRYYDENMNNNTMENKKWTPMGEFVVRKEAHEKTFIENLAELGVSEISKWLGFSTHAGMEKFIGGDSGGFALSAVGGPIFKWQMQKLCSEFPHIYTEMPVDPDPSKQLNNDMFKVPTLAKGYEYLSEAYKHPEDAWKTIVQSIKDRMRLWYNKEGAYEPKNKYTANPKDAWTTTEQSIKDRTRLWYNKEGDYEPKNKYTVTPIKLENKTIDQRKKSINKLRSLTVNAFQYLDRFNSNDIDYDDIPTVRDALNKIRANYDVHEYTQEPYKPYDNINTNTNNIKNTTTSNTSPEINSNNSHDRTMDPVNPAIKIGRDFSNFERVSLEEQANVNELHSNQSSETRRTMLPTKPENIVPTKSRIDSASNRSTTTNVRTLRSANPSTVDNIGILENTNHDRTMQPVNNSMINTPKKVGSKNPKGNPKGNGSQSKRTSTVSRQGNKKEGSYFKYILDNTTGKSKSDSSTYMQSTGSVSRIKSKINKDHEFTTAPTNIGRDLTRLEKIDEHVRTTKPVKNSTSITSAQSGTIISPDEFFTTKINNKDFTTKPLNPKVNKSMTGVSLESMTDDKNFDI